MPKIESLDDLISRKAAEFADQIKAVAAMADKEEEIRIAAERQLAFIEKEAGVKLEGKHEFTVASGRVDSVYSRVIIEYKNPSSPGDRIGPKADSPGSKKVVAQIKKRFYDMRTEHGQPLNTLFGVGLDGNHFIFVRFRDDKWQVQEPVEVNRYSAERFLWPLFNLGTKGKPFSAEYLAGDFGSEAKLARDGIHALYEAIVGATHPKAQTFFSQWKILFGEVCGYDVEHPSDKIRKLGDFYGVPGKGLKPAELLFAVHTYYALFMKLLASEIVAFFHKLPTPLEKMLKAPTSAKLRREMEDLEAGSIFRHLNITNFLEGDLFAWYTAVWSEPIANLVREMVRKLDEYHPGTLSEDPVGSRDLVKKLYQQLFPKSVRHDLGEYYTPDWLAEHVLNELGYVGDPDKRLLDPACGSGTFLVMAINRIRKWYDENRESCRFGEDDLCRKIQANVIGFDLNPLAVMAARTNYLIAIRGLIGHVEKVEIPVYLCDSILTPSEYGGLFGGTTLGKARELRTAAAHFLIPTEIAGHRHDIANYADQLEFCVRNGYSPKEFVDRCRDEGLPVTAESLHTGLYSELVKLDKANKNGVWARIIKNSFAPLFTQPVDFVAGNPPWIRWSDLPKSYRDETKPMWQKYGLFTQTGLAARMGTAELDFSMLFLYACFDVYSHPTSGRLGFLITQECVRSKKAGEGFRRFRFGLQGAPFKVSTFHDFSSMKPFEAANKTAAIICSKGEPTSYPVRYVRWSSRVSDDDLRLKHSWDAAKHVLVPEELRGAPIDGGLGPWQVSSAAQAGPLAKLKGPCDYSARRGGDLEPYGVYFVRMLRRTGPKTLLIENAPDLGKKAIEKLPPTGVEDTHVYPAVRGADVSRWCAAPTFCVLVANRSTRKGDIPSEAALRRDCPKTFAYFNRFRTPLLSRGSNIARNLAEKTSFFAAFGVGEYSFAPVKVTWQRMASSMKAAVVTDDYPVLPGKPCIPTATTSFIAFDKDELDEAHYVCAMLNSTPAVFFFRSYSSAGRGFGSPSLINQLRLLRFAKVKPQARAVCDLSRKCHIAVGSGLVDEVKDIESEIDNLAADIWGITKQELRIM